MKRRSFKVGDQVWYKPGFGTYGYEDVVDATGRVAAEVIGYSPTRVRIRTFNNRGAVDRAVDAASLKLVTTGPTS